MRNRLFLWLVAAAVHLAAASLWAQSEVRSTKVGGRWSVATTWSGGRVPGQGDHVIVVPGAMVLLDTPTLDLSRLEIHGVLRVEDERDYRLRVSRIDVGGMLSYEPGVWGGGGQLHAGSSLAPFRHGLELTLTDDHLANGFRAMPMAPGVPENLSLFVHGASELILHGDPVGGGRHPFRSRVSWSELTPGDVGVLPGATTIPVQGPTGWRPGDRIVLTSTSKDWTEAEELTVTAVQEMEGEDMVRFTPPLAHEHSRLQVEGKIDTMAEVGLLSRNIVIRSEVQVIPSPMPGDTRREVRAGHLMFMAGMGAFPEPVVELDWVELTELGWKGMLGRYPLHFHLLGRASGAGRRMHIAHCSVHHCFNRGLVVHGTDGVVVAGNVLYDTQGHMVYLEDGTEEDNVFLDNLALGARVPDLPLDRAIARPADYGKPWRSLNRFWDVLPRGLQRDYFTPEDSRPAVFWITNPKNVFRGNVAAGGDAQGFWLEIAGDSPAVEAPVMSFDDNTAHSMGQNGFLAETSRHVPVDEAQLPGAEARYQVTNVIRNFRAYKNGRAGIWHRAYGRHSWLDARLADNQIGAIFSAEGHPSDGLFRLNNGVTGVPFKHPPLDAPSLSFFTLGDAVVVGASQNRPGELPSPRQPSRELKGVSLYDGLVLLTGCAFHDFASEPLSTPVTTPFGTLTHTVAMAIGSYGDHPDDVTFALAVDPRAALMDCTFDNCPVPILFPQPHPPRDLGGGTSDRDWLFANLSLSTSILDMDGSLPDVPPGTYLVGPSPLVSTPGQPVPPLHPFGPGMTYSEPQQVGAPGSLQDQCLGQFSLRLAPSVGSDLDAIRLTDQASGNQLDVYEIFSGTQSARRFATNLLLSPQPAPAAVEEVYAVDYLDRDRSPWVQPWLPELQLSLRFGQVGRSVVFRLPWQGAAPFSVRSFHPLIPGSGRNLSRAMGQQAFLDGYGGGVARRSLPMWWHDPAGHLYVRLVLPDGASLDPALGPDGSGAMPVFTGREITVDIR